MLPMIIKKWYYFLLLSILLPLSVNGQTDKIDAFNNKQIRHFKGINNDSALHYSLELQKSKTFCVSFKGKISESLFEYNKGNFLKSEKLALQIIEDRNIENNLCLKKIKIESYNRLFWIKKNQNKYNEAFNYLIKSKEFVKKIPDNDDYKSTISLGITVNMAWIKTLLGHYKESRRMLNVILFNYKSSNNRYKNHESYSRLLNLCSIFNIIGESYLESSKNSLSTDLDSASVYFKRAYQQAKKFIPLHKNSETFYQLREVEVLIAKKKFNEALVLIHKLNDNSIKYKVSPKTNSLKAICFHQLKKNDSAFFYGNLYLKNYKKNLNYKKRLPVIYDILAAQYYKKNQIDSAFKYSELTLVALNLLNESKNEVNRSHYLYDFENAQKLNTLILKKSKNSNTNFILMLVCICLIGFTIIYLMYYQNKKITSKFKKINSGLKVSLPIKKKEYNIDSNLEQDLLKGIEGLKKSMVFLNPDFNINQLAKKLNTNTTYLSYTINKVKKKSFKQYVTQLRIEYLLKKLNEEKVFRSYTIKTLAEEIGYTNASAFTRAFKKYKGITPSEYLRALD
jgi:AraC-like DNA-binding protein